MGKDMKRKKRRRTHFTVRKRKPLEKCSNPEMTVVAPAPPTPVLVKVSTRPKGRYVNLRACMNMDDEEYTELRNLGKELIEKFCNVNFTFDQQNESAKKKCLDEIFKQYPRLIRERDQWVAEELVRTGLINKRLYLHKKKQRKESEKNPNDTSTVIKTGKYGSSKSGVTKPENFTTRGIPQDMDTSPHNTSANENQTICSEDDQGNRKKRVRPISFTNLGQRFVKKRKETTDD